MFSWGVKAARGIPAILILNLYEYLARVIWLCLPEAISVFLSCLILSYHVSYLVLVWISSKGYLTMAASSNLTVLSLSLSLSLSCSSYLSYPARVTWLCSSEYIKRVIGLWPPAISISGFFSWYVLLLQLSQLDCGTFFQFLLHYQTQMTSLKKDTDSTTN